MMARQSYHVGGKHRFWGGLNVEAVGGGPGLIEALYDGAGRLGVEVRYGTKATGLLLGRARRDPRRDLPGPGRLLRGRDPVGGPGVGRIRGEPGVAHAVPRPRLGARPRPRHAPQHRRRDPHRARGRRPALRQLVRLPRGGLGRRLAALRRPSGGRHVPEALVSPRHHRQRPRGAVRGRGRRLPELHVREVRAGDPPAAPAPRVPDLRPEGRADPARGVPDPRGDQGRGGDDRGAGAGSSTSTRAGSCGRWPTSTRRSLRASSIPRCSTARARSGIAPPKSNWAQTLDTPPFVGYAVTCGITFTFGGLRVTPRAEVLDTEDRPIPGLLAAGELVGGLFYENYPGGTGLMAGAAFGRLAGEQAGAYVARAR